MHTTLHTLHFTLGTVHSTLYTSDSTLCTLHFLYSTLHSPRSIPYTPESTLHTPHFARHFAPYSKVYRALVWCHEKHVQNCSNKLFHKSFSRDCISMCFDICTIHIRVSMRVRGLHLVHFVGVARIPVISILLHGGFVTTFAEQKK